METAKLKKFAQFARRSLIEQVSAKLKLVLAEENPARRERPQVIKKLENAVAEQGREQVIERVAYIWFNRFCALRFMDVNRYNRLGIVSPAEGQFQPEILADAKMGQIDEEMVAEATRRRIFALLDGKTPSQDPQGEAYRLLVVAACNHWHSAMPFLFERIDDYTELLMPGDLLSGNSILAYTREAMTPDACEDVEVIGWLYQFYISEKKDKVFEGLKKNQKITPANIPAATQLFTPHWIVRYLVENSLGRLWMLNRPNSELVKQMDYYIKPAPAADGREEPETDFLRINKPEEIKICDPACGSGHMLTYAFDLLYAIYEEEGYEPADIPAKILIYNLFGIEIDERAGALAAFALTMKARAKQRRFFRNPVQPQICVLENVHFDEGELDEYMAVIGRDLFTDELRDTLLQFEQAKNFGSLIVPKLRDPVEALRAVAARDVANDLLLKDLHERVVAVLRMAEALAPKYHVVVANPPYMGSKSMGDALNIYTKENYERSWGDLFAAFMEVGLRLALTQGSVAMINMQSWMFLSSFQGLRERLLSHCYFPSVLHLGTRAFDTISGEVVSTVAFVIEKSGQKGRQSIFFRLTEEQGEAAKSNLLLQAINSGKGEIFYPVDASVFEDLPGTQFAYWASKTVRRSFKEGKLSDHVDVIQGIITGNNDRFIRSWYEISHDFIDFTPHQGRDINKHWLPYLKGGENRKWGGGHSEVVDWRKDGTDLVRARTQNSALYFKKCITWSRLSTSGFFCQLAGEGFLWDVNGSIAVPKDDRNALPLLGLLVSKVSGVILDILAPTMSKNIESISAIPVLGSVLSGSHNTLEDIVVIANKDWDAYETSWDFTTFPLLQSDHRAETLEGSYSSLQAHWQCLTDEMQRLEEENNRIFIDAYGLQDELTPEVPLEEITLTCNPAYRYGGKASVADRETRLRADTVAEFLAYAVGCMFGRYALDKPGLILANQGDTIENYLKQIPEPSFPADDDNVIPMLDGDWFTDDIAERFREFLRVTFGEEHYEENLRFVEQALGKDIRKYFLKDFYNDHVRRYKKRPIYWLFSSPKGSFNALIYMHRYRPDTVSVVLNDYLREFRTKLMSRRDHLEAVSISASASSGEKTKAIKDIEKISKIIVELGDYERDVLYPLATRQVEIDLDDGVKVNYPKFGDALKKITGLSG
ncbi:BREX-1 system adenine-specific DNA-methyltransferase PglX [Marinobacter gelidimuriae]|uniref:BREX-1 system adenine-specific DNA-methyltransferase PglX n=1 Tax=Marinobacter gelidimuriae TaxID=2739064 RepID=UPI000378B11F|nr:BREX-1 system adenine-specific DNA-methyltransferase PglX [Marinobacter gelidimuriae]